MRIFLQSIEAEYERYKALAEGAIAQLEDAELSQPGPNGSSSIATIVWHISGNLASRFTDFLTSDGEKAWRKRDEEFVDRTVTRQELFDKWAAGWRVLIGTLASLSDDDLTRTITIRGQPLAAYEALHRSLAHTSYHVGQIVYLAKAFRGEAWTSLSIPKGASTAYARRPTRDRPTDQAASIERTRE
jgi:hypothetical protein